ncbi:PAS domain-containing protein [uncultured Imperialibacter sp.]|uniref:PAS domain-containing protein n=1 Tax=uncultured Imperialibacter sp. TaxID=1672639 RepID=UPI0030D9E94C|tara:strand:- start:32457 stop:34379 length:1923 start_codon:yes stop_codon:yes gene_type:complete
MKRNRGTATDAGKSTEPNESIKTSISNAYHGVALIDKDYAIQKFNPRFESCFAQITGTAPRRGLSVISSLFAKDQETTCSLFEQAFNEQEVISGVSIKDTYYSFRLEPALDRKGNLIGAFLYLIFENDADDSEPAKFQMNFQALLEASGDAVIVLSPEGKPIYVSPSVENILGYTPEETMLLDMYSSLHPDDVLGNQKVMEKAILNPGIPIKGHRSRIIHKDGSYHVYDSTVVNLINDPSIGGIVDNIKEVTESASPGESDAQFANLYLNAVEDSKIGVWEIDIVSGKSVRNRIHDQIFGYTEQLTQWDLPTLLQHIHAEDRSAANEIFTIAKVEGSFDFEVRAVWPDKSVHWIAMKGTYVKGSQSQTERFSGSVVDITERRTTFHALLNSESRLKGITDHMSEGLIVADKTGRLLYWNAAAVKMHDFMSLQSPPKNFTELLKHFKFEQLNGRPLPISKWPLTRLLNNEKVDGVDVRIKSIKKNWVKVLRYNGGSFADNHGSLVYFLTISDKTEISNIKKHLRDSEERFLDAFHASPVALCITSSKDAICLEINKSAEELLGYSYEEYTGKPILTLNGVPLGEMKKIFSRNSKHSKSWESKLSISTKRGQKRLILFSVEQVTLNGEECRLTVFVDTAKAR